MHMFWLYYWKQSRHADDDIFVVIGLTVWHKFASRSYTSKPWTSFVLSISSLTRLNHLYFREKFAICSADNCSVFKGRVLYLACKICVLYGPSQNLYLSGAQNLYFAVLLMHGFIDLPCLIIKCETWMTYLSSEGNLASIYHSGLHWLYF